MTAAFLDWCITISLGLVVIAIALGFVRLVKGPTLADRVVALDMMSVGIIACCGLFAIRAGVEAYLDIAVTLALVSFLTVVALARYAERLMPRNDGDD